MADAIKGSRFGVGQVGVLQGISFGGPTSWTGDDTFARMFQVGAMRSDTEGLLAPSMELRHVGFWRFRWPVATGARSLQVWVKQAVNISPRPAMIVRANPDVGLAADITEVAAGGTGWTKIGPAAFVATGNGSVWVELHNRVVSEGAPAFFDYVDGDMLEEFTIWVNGAPVIPSSGNGEGGGGPTLGGSRRVSPMQPRSRTPL